MSDQDPFAQTDPTALKPVEPATDPFADQLKEIVSDDGRPKYETIPDALNALKHAQEHIKRLEQEKRDQDAQFQKTQEELSKMKTIDEFVGSLKPNDTPPKTPEATPDGAGKGVDVDTLEQLLEQKLKARDSEAVKAANLNSVVRELSTIYGDKTSEHINKVAAELGTTTAKLRELSQENPKLALSVLKQTSPKIGAPITSSINAPKPNDKDNPRPTWERGAARGGLSDRELAERWKAVGSYTNKRIGVEN